MREWKYGFIASTSHIVTGTDDISFRQFTEHEHDWNQKDQAFETDADIARVLAALTDALAALHWLVPRREG